MAKISHLIFGYRILDVDVEDVACASSVLLKSNYSAEISTDGKIYVKEKDYVKIREILSGRVKFDVSKPMGIFGAWKNYDHKIALLISLLISVFIVLVFSNVVWDIRVDDSFGMNENQLAVCLSECGISVGNFWNRLNISEIETCFLLKNQNVSWININRRGTVAYISLMLKDDTEDSGGNQNESYTNIVASYDCVIEDISVKRGVAMVKVGDTVKKGDLLILGATSIAEGGEFCCAEGVVRGRISERISVEIPREYEKKTYMGSTIYSITVNLFKISINIFKRYGNLTTECDIIDHEMEYSIGDSAPLPVSMRISYIPRYTVSTDVYSDADISELARARLDVAVASRLFGCDLLRVKSDCNITDAGINMYSDLTFITSVGDAVTFDID